MNIFERYLTLWVALCMVAGVALGLLFPGLIDSVRSWELAKGSQINLFIMLLIWLMVYPMMLKIDFGSIKEVGAQPKGILVTLFVNWIVKPFSMAFLGIIFFKYLFSHYLSPDLANQYLAGVIILAAAPCTAMVFVWSYLVKGNPAYTLMQVALNDLVMLVLFVPIVTLLVGGTSSLQIPFPVLIYSVVAFIVIPFTFGALSRLLLLRTKGQDWFEKKYLRIWEPLSMISLLATLVLIFAFQAHNLTSNWIHVAIIAIPITIQVYFNSSITYLLMKWLKLPHNIAAPGALIGASNFFELAVATAIALFGADSGAALATVVGVLVEVPVMLSVCSICNQSKNWYERK